MNQEERDERDKKMIEEQKIHVWADYSWCYDDELEDNLNYPMAKSDDFITVDLNFGDEPTLEQLKRVIDGI